MSIWTRERKLLEERDELLESLVRLSHGMREDLNGDNWGLAASKALVIHLEADRMEQLSNELENVTAIIESLNRIDERFEKLEKQNVSDN